MAKPSSQCNNLLKCNPRIMVKAKANVDTPRLDPTERLRHRFYEPLLLLGMLNPRRNGGHAQPTIAFHNRNFISDWRRFLDALAWFGDYRHGGDTVTAVAANSSPAGVCFWVASAHQKSATLIREILQHLSTLSAASEDDRNAAERTIIAQSMRSSNDKIKAYIRSLRLNLAAVSSVQLPGVAEDIQTTTQAIQRVLELQENPGDFCAACLNFDCQPQLDRIIQSESSVASYSDWVRIRHCIGRIGMWHRKATIITKFSCTYAYILSEATCQHLKLPKAAQLPEADTKTHLTGALKRMLPADEQHRVTGLHNVLTQLRGFDMEGSFIDCFRKGKLNLRVHAEVFLAEYLCSNKISYLENDKYVGCSKASCYCCSLYLRYHPDNLVVRPSHGNVWRTWCPPLMAQETSSAQAKHNLHLMNKVIAHIRRDVLYEIEMKIPRWDRVPDSSSAISTQ